MQLFDGHNGSAAAIYSKENLLNNVLNAIPSDLNRDEWIAALPRALVAGFVKTDKDFQERGTVFIFILYLITMLLYVVLNVSIVNITLFQYSFCYVVLSVECNSTIMKFIYSSGRISAQMSGTTVTFVIIEGWVITVASVGDSRCILEAAEGGIYYLSADHRLECNEEE